MKFPAFEPIALKDNCSDYEVLELALPQIIPDQNQPRKNFDEAALHDLANSIRQHGIIQPIIVKECEDISKYKIIAGERRWRAAGIMALETIPAIIQKSSVEENVAISLIENIQREELNPIELAEAFYCLQNDYGLSHEKIALSIGKSRAGVTNLIRLLNLTQYVRDLLVAKKLEMGHARALLTLPEAQQKLFATKIIDNSLTVRETERIVKLQKAPSNAEGVTNPYIMQCRRWSNELSDRLSSTVKVKLNAKGEGRVVIQVSSPDEVDQLLKQLVEMN